MKVRRLLFVGALLASLSVIAIPAQARSENPYWRFETNIAVDTIDGDWSIADDGMSATLRFQGVSVAGQESTFRAGWLTGWVKGSHAEQGQLNLIAAPMADGDLTVMTRVQTKGHGWGPWFRLRLPWRDFAGGYLWAGGTSSSSRGLVRYDWKLIGTVTGTNYLDGSVEVSVE